MGSDVPYSLAATEVHGSHITPDPEAGGAVIQRLPGLYSGIVSQVLSACKGESCGLISLGMHLK